MTFPSEPPETAWVQAFDEWMKSKKGHCSNMMNAEFSVFGMVEARGFEDRVFPDGISREVKSAYWTQNFGAE